MTLLKGRARGTSGRSVRSAGADSWSGWSSSRIAPHGGSYPRAARIVGGRTHRGARGAAYSSIWGTGNADGVDGDTILLGPPFVITDDELQRVAEVIAEAVDVATASEAAAR